jgi:hypothetical protein
MSRRVDPEHGDADERGLRHGGAEPGGGFHEGGHDPHVFLAPLEPGDPGPGVLATLDAHQIAAFFADESGRVPVDQDDNPAPGGSLGFVDRFVAVAAKAARGTLVIRLDAVATAGVAVESLRVFRFDEESEGFYLVPRSGLGQTRDYVWAELDQPGRYAVIGLPSDPLVGRTLAVMRELTGLARVFDQSGAAFAERVCQLVLCAPEARQTMRDPAVLRGLVEDNLRRGLPAPGPGWDATTPSDVCERCLGLNLPRSPHAELPEFQIWPHVGVHTPSDGGRWEILPESSQVLAVHAALLPTGQVLYFSGSEHDQDRNAAGDVDHSRVWDPATGIVHVVGSPAHDLFCCGQALLGDGRLLAAGGTQEWSNVPIPGDPHGHAGLGHFRGLRNATVFDGGGGGTAGAWTPVSPMLPERGRTTGGGRWYPTLVTLPNGRVLAMSGHPEKSDSRHNNDSLETFSPQPAPNGAWHDEGDLVGAPGAYPRLHVLPDGRVLSTTPIQGATRAWNPTSGLWSQVAPPLDAAVWGGFGTSSVLLPLRPEDGYQARVLVTGAATPRRLDLAAGTPTWQDTAPRSLPGSPVRQHSYVVLLPDASVLVIGGSRSSNDSDAVRTAERYDPATDRWESLATAAVPRLYHSVALLLPDGRVWTCGSNHDCKQSYHDVPPTRPDNRELRMEVFRPPYLFQGPQPKILDAPDTLDCGTEFEVKTPEAVHAGRVALLRCGSVTHAFDSDQRYVGLPVHGRHGNRLNVGAPPDNSVAPPGLYMLFVVDRHGIPSRAHLLRVSGP